MKQLPVPEIGPDEVLVEIKKTVRSLFQMVEWS
jgi:hypothetical protein